MVSGRRNQGIVDAATGDPRRYVSLRTCAGIRGDRANTAAALTWPSCQEANAATTTLVSTAITGGSAR